MAEVLITLAILVVILITLAKALDGADRAWKAGATDPYASAQEAFETVASHLADATLETYGDYADATGNFTATGTFVPDHLARRSDLAFTCGPASGVNGVLTSSGRTTAGSAVFFAATEGSSQTYIDQGLGRLLNDMGYFVEFGDNDSEPPFLRAFSHRATPRLIWGGVSIEEQGALGDLLLKLKQAGLELTDGGLSTLSERIAFPLQRAASPAPMPGGFSLPLSLTAGDRLVAAGQAAVDRIASSGAADLSQAFRGSLAPVRRIIAESQSAAECEMRIKEFYADWRPDRLAGLIGEALEAYAANGAASRGR